MLAESEIDAFSLIIFGISISSLSYDSYFFSSSTLLGLYLWFVIVLCGQPFIRSLSSSSISGMDWSDSPLCYDIPFRIEFAECISCNSISFAVNGPLVTGLTETLFVYTSGCLCVGISFVLLFAYDSCSAVLPFSKSASGSFILDFQSYNSYFKFVLFINDNISNNHFGNK